MKQKKIEFAQICMKNANFMYGLKLGHLKVLLLGKNYKIPVKTALNRLPVDFSFNEKTE